MGTWGSAGGSCPVYLGTSPEVPGNEHPWGQPWPMGNLGDLQQIQALPSVPWADNCKGRFTHLLKGSPPTGHYELDVSLEKSNRINSVFGTVEKRI